MSLTELEFGELQDGRFKDDACSYKVQDAFNSKNFAKTDVLSQRCEVRCCRYTFTSGCNFDLDVPFLPEAAPPKRAANVPHSQPTRPSGSVRNFTRLYPTPIAFPSRPR